MTCQIEYHAVMIDETGCEFPASVKAYTREEAYLILQENYPESRVDQLESPTDREERTHRTYQHILKGGDWDDEGRPIFHYPEEPTDD